MDAQTKHLLNEILVDRTLSENLQLINKIYAKFSNHDIITIDLVRNIFNAINAEYYQGQFYIFLQNGQEPNRPYININDTATELAETDAILSAVLYDEQDREFLTHDFGFNVAITCLNSIDTPNIYYSGGYITDSKIKFIILMLLHESLHIIEYKDRALSKAKTEHSKFFYKIAYKKFKIISRLSEIISDIGLLNYEDTERINRIEQISQHKNQLQDGVNLLNDHSSCETFMLGYTVLCHT